MQKTIVYNRKQASKVTKLDLIALYKGGYRKIVIDAMGYDYFPINQARAMGFEVKWLPDYCSSELAEHGMKMFLQVYRKRAKLIDDKGKLRLSTLTALVIGSEGNVGKKMVAKCKYYFKRVLKHDKKLEESRLAFEQKLKLADVIFLCIPLNIYTREYFMESDFKLMKKQPFIINVSGRLDLLPAGLAYKELKNQRIAGYACDEMPKYPRYQQNHYMFFTPHTGWRSDESIEKRKQLLQNILDR